MIVCFREWLKEPVAAFLQVVVWALRILICIVSASIIVGLGDVFGGEKEDLYWLAVLMGAYVVISTLIKHIIKLSSRRMYISLEKSFANKLISAKYRMFTEIGISKINTISAFIDKIVYVVISFGMVIESVAVLIINIGTLYMIAGKVSYLIAIIYLIGTIAMMYLYKTLAKTDAKMKDLRMRRTQMEENMVTGFAEIRSFSQQRKVKSEYFSEIERANEVLTCRDKMMVHIIFWFNFIEKLSILVTIVAGIWLVQSGAISAPTAVSIVMLVEKLIDPIGFIVDWVDSLSRDLALADDWKRLMQYPEQEDTGSMIMNTFTTDIVFQNVNFSYDMKSDVLRNLSIRFPKGKKIGICGRSGDGKSTILSMLNRFYDPDSGNILVDGIGVKSIKFGFISKAYCHGSSRYNNLPGYHQGKYHICKTMRNRI